MASSGLPLFRSMRLLRWLNVAGVGLSLAALTGASFGTLFGSSEASDWDRAALTTALPTLVHGVLWAALLRWRRTVGRRQVRVGWLLSVPLAISNATLAASVMFGESQHGIDGVLMLVPMFLMSATVGVMFWGPALAATLALFGAPIAWAQRQAQRGLAGEERGELIVGGANAVLGLLGLLAVLLRPFMMIHLDPIVRPSSIALQAPSSPASWSIAALALLGTLTGASASVLAWRREQRRRRFVADAESGRVPGYRVEPTEAGKVLVRLARPAAGEHAYRAGSLDDEEIFALDEQGLATHAPELAHEQP